MRWRIRKRWAVALQSARCAGLGARKVTTQKAPVVFEPRVARSLLDNIFDAISGDSVYRGETFLAGKLGQKDRLRKVDRHRRRDDSQTLRLLAV